MNAEKVLKDFSEVNKMLSEKLEKDVVDLKNCSVDMKYNKHLINSIK